MTNRWMVLMTVAAALLAVGPLPAAAQEVQVTGPLAGEPAVRHMRMYREGRIQLTPVVSFTLQDEFSRTLFTGLQASYHFVDWLGIGLWGAFGAANIDTDLTDQVQKKGTTRDRNALSLPTGRLFPDQIATMSWAAAAQLNFIPLRGKLSLFQKLHVDTDFFIFGGVAAVGIEERASVTDGSATCPGAPPVNAQPGDDLCVESQVARESRIAIAPTFGVGLNFYINDFLALMLEWRGLPFAWNTHGFDVHGGANDGPDGVIDEDDRDFHFNHMVSLGFSFILPTEAKISD